MIFDEQVARKPDRYPWTEEFIRSMWDGIWFPHDFNFQSDVHQFKTEMTPEEQRVITSTLSAIGQIEIAVKKFWSRLGDNLPHPSITDLGLVMSHIEVIHNKAYEKLLSVLDLHEQFEANLQLDIIKGRVAYLRKYLDKPYKDNRKQYVYSLILFTLFVENVSLFSQFYIILWFNRFRNVLKDTANQVSYTKNEESIHALVGVKLINTIRVEHPELFDEELAARIKQEAQEAFKAESKIVDWMLGEYAGDHLSPTILKEYVKGRINDSLDQIGFAAAFETDATLLRESNWMNEEVLGTGMTDFFHARPVGYSRAHANLSESDIFD